MLPQQAPLLALFQSSLADLRVAQGHQVESSHSDHCNRHPLLPIYTL